jgi:hypothetical protein
MRVSLENHLRRIHVVVPRLQADFRHLIALDPPQQFCVRLVRIRLLASRESQFLPQVPQYFLRNAVRQFRINCAIAPSFACGIDSEVRAKMMAITERKAPGQAVWRNRQIPVRR